MDGLWIYFIVHMIIVICFRCAYNMSRLNYYNDDYKRKYSKSAILMILIGYIIYILFAVGREIKYGVGGIDAYHYKNAFEFANSYSLTEFIFAKKEEISYKIIVWSIRQISNDFRWVLFICHTIVYFCYAYFFKHIRTRNNGILCWIGTFLICGELFTMFCTLRTGVAVAISAVIFIMIEKKAYKKGIFLLIIAISFHISTVILLIPLILCWIRQKYMIMDSKRFIPLILAGAATEIALMPVLSTLISSSVYAVYDNSSGIAIGTYTVIGFTIILMVLKNRQMQEESFINDNLLMLMCALLVAPVQSWYSIAYRMVLVFMPLLYKNLIELSDKYKIGRETKLYNVMICGYSVIYFVYRVYTLYTTDFISNGLIPYSFIGLF